MKLVEFVVRIPTHLDLHFYDFSMNFYTFSKITDLNFRVHVTFSLRPLKSSFWFTIGSFACFPLNKAVGFGQIPVREHAGGGS